MMARTALAALLLFATPAAAEDAGPPVATVTIEQVQLALIVSGNLGGGVLTFEGEDHPFTIGGLGVGGVGASKISAAGEVWGLTKPEDFEGVYAQVRAGAVAGDYATTSALWLENGSGVRVRLDSEREGFALSVGGDAIVIELD